MAGVKPSPPEIRGPLFPSKETQERVANAAVGRQRTSRRQRIEERHFAESVRVDSRCEIQDFRRAPRFNGIGAYAAYPYANLWDVFDLFPPVERNIEYVLIEVRLHITLALRDKNIAVLKLLVFRVPSAFSPFNEEEKCSTTFTQRTHYGCGAENATPIFNKWFDHGGLENVDWQRRILWRE